MSLQGKIIEYVDHGKFICAYVQEDLGKRLRLLNQNSREVNLPLARLVHQNSQAIVGGSKEELLAVLKQTAVNRQAMTSEVRLQEIWELACDENTPDFAPRFLTELCFGAATGDDHEAAFLRCVFEDKLFFKYRDGRVLVHAPEVVEQLRLRQKKEEEKQAFIEHSAKGLAEIMQGDESVDWPERGRCLYLLQQYYLLGNEAEESELARELLNEAGLTRPHDPYFLLIKAGFWQRDENIPLLRYGFPTAFSEEALAQVGQLPKSDAQTMLDERRKDFRDLDLFTIDGPLTRDYDDALHLEKKGDNYLVGIHIADVARYVKPGDPLFEEALARGTSLYFPAAVVPMLPPEISEGVCSLIAGEDRAAMSFMVTISPQAEVLDFDIVASVVRVKRQLTYAEVDAAADTDPVFKVLVDLTKKLQAKRVAAGALILSVPDVNISLDDEGCPDVSLSPVDAPGRSLVAELMVLANSLGARYVADREAAGLFRGQAPPRKLMLHGASADFYTIYRQRKFLSRGQLTTAPKPHSGVGVMQYTTLTSPIRRLLDLIMQHQLGSLIRGKGEFFEQREMEEMVPVILSRQTKANLVRQQRHRYWLLKYLENKVGERLDALVLERGPKRINLVLSDILMDVDLPPSQGVSVAPGATVQVKIAQVSPLDNILRLEW